VIGGLGVVGPVVPVSDLAQFPASRLAVIATSANGTRRAALRSALFFSGRLTFSTIASLLVRRHTCRGGVPSRTV